MRIIIAGINHHDPFCPGKVIYLLERLRKLSFIPDCVATEWDREVAKKAIAKRPRFVSLATSNGFSIAEGNALAGTMAYEAETHKTIYRDLPIVWLDELSDKERVHYHNVINNPEYYKMNTYNKFKKFNGTENRLNHIARAVWNDDGSGGRKGQDEKFFNKICEKVGYSNLFVLVGARHADPENEDNLYNKLIYAGYNVQVYILDPAFSENTPIELDL
jgi:hypothetical protein